MSKFSPDDIKKMVHEAYEQAAKEIYKQSEKDPGKASLKAFSAEKIDIFYRDRYVPLLKLLNGNDAVMNSSAGEGVITTIKDQFTDAIVKYSSIKEKERGKKKPHISVDHLSLKVLDFEIDVNFTTNTSVKKVYGVSMVDPGSIRSFNSEGKGADVKIKGTEQTSSTVTVEGKWEKRHWRKQESSKKQDNTLRPL